MRESSNYNGVIELPEKPLFSIYQVDGEDRFYAVSESSPMFCIVGETAGLAAEKAMAALSFYRLTKEDELAQARSGPGL